MWSVLCVGFILKGPICKTFTLKLHYNDQQNVRRQRFEHDFKEVYVLQRYLLKLAC